MGPPGALFRTPLVGVRGQEEEGLIAHPCPRWSPKTLRVLVEGSAQRFLAAGCEGWNPGCSSTPGESKSARGGGGPASLPSSERSLSTSSIHLRTGVSERGSLRWQSRKSSGTEQ